MSRACPVPTEQLRRVAVASYGGLVELAGLTRTDQGTVLGLLLEGAQRLPQEPATRQR